MNKKLPCIYKASDCSHIKNNKTVFCSSDVNFDFTNDDRVTSDVSEIDYVFNTPVTINTNEEVIRAKIVGKYDDHILTSNNKIIKLKDIKSIDF